MNEIKNAVDIVNNGTGQGEERNCELEDKVTWTCVARGEQQQQQQKKEKKFLKSLFDIQAASKEK